EFYRKLLRARDLEAQRTRSASSLEATLEAVLEVYLKTKDPVVKAKRILRKKQAQSERTTKKTKTALWTSTVVTAKVEEQELAPKHESALPYKRVPLTAEEKHVVFDRDGGRCTRVNEHGVRCTNERWVQIHHIQPVRYGGNNDPENLTTLCWSCHDLCHQLVLPLEEEEASAAHKSRLPN
ncbi:MAG: HNH endonuclease, partial [Bdellovibrionales bacterium]|nr:HNH endonuclease [Bdellovibrionales bacterium]